VTFKGAGGNDVVRLEERPNPEPVGEEILAQAEGSDVVTEAAEKWLRIITEELGYDEDVSYAELGGWYEKDKLDLDPYLDRLRDELFDAHRPA
jgi:hypothetical protein